MVFMGSYTRVARSLEVKSLQSVSLTDGLKTQCFKQNRYYLHTRTLPFIYRKATWHL